MAEEPGRKANPRTAVDEALIVLWEAADRICGKRAARLPFPLIGLGTDNDGAFMNDTLWDYCQQRGLDQSSGVILIALGFYLLWRI